jgi:hypothetical protein
MSLPLLGAPMGLAGLLRPEEVAAAVSKPTWEAGARRAVQILHEELRTTLALAGCPSVRALNPSWAGTVQPSRTAVRPCALDLK